jgi:hypothetical protein
MIKCSICSTLNDEFAVVCTSCHGYLQERVPNLDFFSTFWKLIESPRQAFRHIIISEHKNYIIVLNLIMGPMLMFGMMWAWKTGEYFDNLLFLMLLGIVAGVMISPVYFLVSNALVFGIMRLFRGEGTWRNTMAVLAWSHSPFMFAFLIVLPIQLAVLGLPLFSRNPSLPL